MILDHILPSRQFVLDCPFDAAEAAAKLKAVTVKRHWIRFWSGVPGTFEGYVRGNRFSLLTSAEAYQFFGFTRTRNMTRPVCSGRIEPASNGCRVVVRLRPQLGFVLLMIYIFAFAGFVGWFLYHDGLYRDFDFPFPLIIFPIVIVLNLAIYLGFTGTMGKRARAALQGVLRD